MTSVTACRESHEKDVEYVAGGSRGYVPGADTWPELPCLPVSDPRLLILTPDCAAEDVRVSAGPVQDGARCLYRISYTTEPGVMCQVGRPLADESGAPRTAGLSPTAAWC